MGLHKSTDGNKNEWLVLWAVPAIILGISIIIMLAGEPGKEWLRYDRVWIGQGEAWRFLSGHFTHLGWSHLALNGAGLLLVWFLIGQAYAFSTWIQITLLLHGLLVAGIIPRLRSLDIETGILLLLLIAKIGYEQFNGPVPGSETTSGGPVVVDAHLYGALGGVLGAILARIRGQWRASI